MVVELVGRHGALPTLGVRDELTSFARLLIEIDGAPVEFAALRREDRWIAQGRWDTYAVEIHGTLVEPESVKLQRAASIPSR